jgi:hypothetical protein
MLITAGPQQQQKSQLQHECEKCCKYLSHLAM